MILVIDNYDSFTFNIVQYFGELGALLKVVRNDEVTIADIEALQPDRIVVSPGPCAPAQAGVSCDAIAHFGQRMPVFGVCLGQQCMAEAFGGRVVRADRLMHGKTSPILHRGESVLKGMPNPFEATRYHSLLVERASLPACLKITAETAEGEIMGLQHVELPIHGVQFHPESILTQEGKRILENFLAL